MKAQVNVDLNSGTVRLFYPEKAKLKEEVKGEITGELVEDDNKLIQVQNTGQAQPQGQINTQTEQKLIGIKPMVQENYFHLNSRCRISLKQYKKDVNLPTNPDTQTNSVVVEYGLMELENENYTDLKNYFGSKTNKLFINITMAGEEIQELRQTLNGILDNMNYLNKKLGLAQNDVSIIIVADGIANLHPDFKQLLFKSETLIKDPNTAPREVVKDYMHCFRTIFGDSTYSNADGKFRRLDLLFVVKENDSGIINSHMCFLNGFCHFCKENFISGEQFADVHAVLTSTGTVLDSKALWKCYSTLNAYTDTTAVAGQVEINTDNHLILSWIAGQYLDNKVNHVFERHLESLLGHINNLNSEFSFFKLKAMTKEFTDNYFKNSLLEEKFVNPFEKVIRDYSGKFLSGKLLLTQNTLNKIKLAPEAIAKVNPASEFLPKTNQVEKEKITDFASYLHNRRQLYNSKLMSTLNFISEFCGIWKTPHSGIQKLAFCILAIYHLITQAMDYVMLSFNYIFIYVILSQCFFFRPDTTTWLMWCYLILIGVFLIIALSHNNVRHFETVYFILICFLFTFYVFVVGCWCYTMYYLSGTIEIIFNDITNFNISPTMHTNSDYSDKMLQVYYRIDRPVIIGVFIINFLGYLIPLIFAMVMNPIHLLRPLYFGIVSYLFTLPTYGGVQQIYALSNCDFYELSTLKLSKEEESERTSVYRKFKVVNILVFLVINGLFIFIFAQTADNIQAKASVLAGMVYFFTFFFLFKSVLASIDVIKYMCEKQTRKYANIILTKKFSEKKIQSNTASNINMDNVDLNSSDGLQTNIEVKEVNQPQVELKTGSVLDKLKSKEHGGTGAGINVNLNNLANVGIGVNAGGNVNVNANSKFNSSINANANINTNVNFGLKGDLKGNASIKPKDVNKLIDDQSFEQLDREEELRQHKINESLPEIAHEGRTSPSGKKINEIDVNADINFQVGDYDNDEEADGDNDGERNNILSKEVAKLNSKGELKTGAEIINLHNINLHNEVLLNTQGSKVEGVEEVKEDKNNSLVNFEVTEQVETRKSHKEEKHSVWDSQEKKLNVQTEGTFKASGGIKLDLDVKNSANLKSSVEFDSPIKKKYSEKQEDNASKGITSNLGASGSLGASASFGVGGNSGFSAKASGNLGMSMKGKLGTSFQDEEGVAKRGTIGEIAQGSNNGTEEDETKRKIILGKSEAEDEF